MDDGFIGPFAEIFSCKHNTQQLSYEVCNLTASRNYRFRVVAIDINGPGHYSNVTNIQACNPPMFIASPIISNVQQTSFVITWKAPSSLGGCPITSYQLFRDNGDGGNVNIQIDPN